MLSAAVVLIGTLSWIVCLQHQVWLEQAAILVKGKKKSHCDKKRRFGWRFGWLLFPLNSRSRHLILARTSLPGIAMEPRTVQAASYYPLLATVPENHS